MCGRAGWLAIRSGEFRELGVDHAHGQDRWPAGEVLGPEPGDDGTPAYQQEAEGSAGGAFFIGQLVRDAVLKGLVAQVWVRQDLGVFEAFGLGDWPGERLALGERRAQVGGDLGCVGRPVGDQGHRDVVAAAEDVGGAGVLAVGTGLLNVFVDVLAGCRRDPRQVVREQGDRHLRPGRGAARQCGDVVSGDVLRGEHQEVDVSPEQRLWTLVLWNPWFLVGGLVFGVSAWEFGSANGSSGGTA